jgi:hypothetical protein
VTIKFTPEETAEAERLGLAPYRRYTQAEAAETLGVDLLRVGHLVRSGELDAVRGHRETFVVGAAIARWLLAQRKV